MKTQLHDAAGVWDAGLMGRQVVWYLDTQDADAFRDLAWKRLGAILIDSESPSDAVVRLEDGMAIGFKCYLVRESDVGALKPVRLRGSGPWTLDDRREPVVEWILAPERDQMLRAGRLYLPTDGEARHRDPEFDAFAVSLFRLARRFSSPDKAPWGSVRLGPSARRRLAESDVSLAMTW